MISVACFAFNPFQENTFVVYDPTGECVIVDAGCSSPGEERTLADFIAQKGLRPVMAVNTHGHVDHILGVDWVKERYGVPFALDSRDSFLVENAPFQGSLYGLRIASAPTPDVDLSQLQQIDFGDSRLKIIHTPGHTPGHVCLHDPEGEMLLTGDTLFRESIGRTDLPGGDYSWIMRSILERIMPLGDGTTIYPGHGPQSDIGHEMLYNPFVVEVLQGEVKP
ncbi:MBL fold metallo-hydrolase [Bacteroidia bacterium]|nr:MBL fold metallo-hydrolase [Bacteroidia bacterium]